MSETRIHTVISESDCLTNLQVLTITQFIINFSNLIKDQNAF